MTRIIIDNKIPYIKGILEPYAEVEYIAPEKIDRNAVKDADILIIRTRTHCNAELLEGSKCKFIGTATIGYDHIDTAYCSANGILWKNAPGCNAPSVGQYILASLLLLQERYGILLREKTIGIVGVGHVGTIIEKYCRLIGMNVLRNDPPRARKESAEDFVSLEEIAEKSDIITFHTPLIKEGDDKTYHLCNNKFLNRLCKKPIIINSSRGEIIDNTALLDASRKGLVSEYILDCWENEPHISRELLERAFIATPHIAGYSADGKSNATRQMVNAVSGWIKKKICSSNIIPPSPPFDNITIPEEADALTASVLATYDPRQDMASLLAHPEDFEKLRGNYGLRREFGAYTLNNCPPEIVPILQELGFNIQ